MQLAVDPARLSARCAMKFNVAILSVAALTLMAGQSRAQTGFAATEVNRLSQESNSANYSSERIRSAIINNAVPRFGTSGVTTGTIGNALGRANKPFSSISRGPSVTPYLALDNPFTSSATSYYTQIRPQIEQQRVNQNQQRQNQLLQRQISQFTSQRPYDPTGSETQAPTGHAATFLNQAGLYSNYGGYYTVPRPRPGR